MDLNDVRIEHFQPLLTENFKLENSDVRLTLLEVKTLNTRADATRTAFSLLFGCPVPAPQGTYALHHEALGNLEIFLVPVKQDGAGVQLEAVFS
jgi:hypothetical protein